MKEWGTALIALATAVLGVAIVAILISPNAQTAGVINAAGGAFGNILDVAISPVTGNTVSPQLGSTGGGGFTSNPLSMLSSFGGGFGGGGFGGGSSSNILGDVGTAATVAEALGAFA